MADTTGSEIAEAVDPATFHQWLRHARPGEWCRYHVGKSTCKDDRKTVLPVCKVAAAAFDRDEVILLQHKLFSDGPENFAFAYLAQKRDVDAPLPVIWRQPVRTRFDDQPKRVRVRKPKTAGSDKTTEQELIEYMKEEEA